MGTKSPHGNRSHPFPALAKNPLHPA
jgi:hypothetical protein